MSKISTYTTVAPVAGDKVIGTDVGGTPADATKNFKVEDIAALAGTGGYVTLEQVLTAGNTATNTITLTGTITQPTGNHDLTAGNITLAAGNVNLTSGNVNINAGTLSVGPGGGTSSFQDNVSFTEEINISSANARIRCATGLGNNGEVLTSQGSGLVPTWSVITKANYANIFKGSSVTAATNIAPIDTPVQVEFGAAQNSASDPAMMDVNGVITFNEAGTYVVEPILTFAQRTATTSTTTQFALGYDAAGGTTYQNVKPTEVVMQYDEPTERKTWSQSFKIVAAAGSTCIMRVCASSTNSGTADCRLQESIGATGDLGASPASSISVWRLS